MMISIAKMSSISSPLLEERGISEKATGFKIKMASLLGRGGESSGGKPA